MMKTFALFAALVVCCGVVEAAVVEVWPGEAPGEVGGVGEEMTLPPREGETPVRRLTNVTRPTLTIYQPPAEKHTGTSVVICPGGGYRILAIDKEGEEVAAWLNTLGVTGIVLKYRIPAREGQPKHQAPLQDAQRAISLVRTRAKEWNLNPARIGILGFSAGGHLSATAATNHDKRHYAPIDAIDQASCRPDFAVLVYPAYLTDGNQLSPEIRVNESTPPVFFVHAGDDRISSENSIQMYLALKRHGIPAELHVYASGGHGFGLRPSAKPCSTWPTQCAAWLKSQGLVPAPGQPSF
jgi:acetyl esterase/lipase